MSPEDLFLSSSRCTHGRICSLVCSVWFGRHWQLRDPGDRCRGHFVRPPEAVMDCSCRPTWDCEVFERGSGPHGWQQCSRSRQPSASCCCGCCCEVRFSVFFILYSLLDAVTAVVFCCGYCSVCSHSFAVAFCCFPLCRSRGQCSHSYPGTG